MNDKFYNLPVEKQNAIINAALHVFAENDYKKASTEEITRLAGISQGPAFSLFRQQKELYLHLYQYAEKSLIEGMRRYYDSEETDFFKALISAQMAKVQVLHQHPDLISFLVRAYLEHDDAVEAQLDTQVQRHYLCQPHHGPGTHRRQQIQRKHFPGPGPGYHPLDVGRFYAQPHAAAAGRPGSAQ